MATLGRLTVEGVDDVLFNLSRVGQIYEQELADGMETVAIRVQQDARRNAPINKIGSGDVVGGPKTYYYDSVNGKKAYRGRLKNSIEYIKGDGPTEWIVYAGGKPRNGRRGKQSAGRTTDDIYYAAFVELGTPGMQARPFLRGALVKNTSLFKRELTAAWRRTLRKFRPR